MMRITLLYCVGAAQGNSAAQTAAIMPLLGEKIALPSTPNVSAVHTVHLVFSHHLDVGLNKALQFAQFCNGFATKIVQQYFDDFIPRAISIAKELNDDEDSFAYTLHPWIVSLYVDCVPWDVPDGCPLNPGKLRCPSKAQVGEFDDAVRRGHLLWADSPMNLDAGVVGEPGMFEALVDIAGALNERYNLTKTARVWSNVDVPGFVRSSIPPLRRANVTALSVCANDNGNGPIEFIGSSKDPNQKTKDAAMWRWHDPVSDEEILVLYHKAQSDTASDIPISSAGNTYGGFTRADNTIITPGGGMALASYVGSDNTGPPPSARVVKDIYKKVRKIFPNAKIFSSTWDHFVSNISKEEVAALPRFSSEWGDKWVTGMATDPGRLATYRATIRARAACIAAGKCNQRDQVLRNLTRWAAKVQHTLAALHRVSPLTASLLVAELRAYSRDRGRWLPAWLTSLYLVGLDSRALPRR
jgi:hypothetical protein